MVRQVGLRLNSNKNIKNNGNDTAVDPNAPEGGQQLPAQGNALGERVGSKPAPYRGKSIKRGRAFALSARPSHEPCPPRALPWAMSGLALQAALYPKGATAILLPKNKE